MESYKKKNLTPFEGNFQDQDGTRDNLQTRYDAEGRPLNAVTPPIPPMPSFNEDANLDFCVDKCGEIVRCEASEGGYSR